MPIYEYACDSCRKIHEVMQKFSDAPLSECPECGKPVTKLMSLTSFALKGSGWYTTDYKRGSSSKPASSSSTTSSTSESSTSSEKKPSSSAS